MRHRCNERQKELAMQHRPVGVATSQDSNDPHKEDQPTNSVVQHVVPARNSLDQATQAEEQSAVSPSAPSDLIDEAFDDRSETISFRQLTLEKFYNTLWRDYSDSIAFPHDISTSRWSGDTIWKLDASNISLARAAIANLDMQCLDDEAMTKALLSMPPSIWLTNLRALCGDRWSLDAKQLLLARRLGIIDKLPSMTEGEIEDLNKSDMLLKIVAVLQILWLCVQLCTRLSHRIPTTQLEVVTLAFAVCSIFTYLLFLSRPKDVHTVQGIDASRYPTPSEILQIAVIGPGISGCWRQDVAIPNNSIHRTGGLHFPWSTCILIFIFGALHLISWKYNFPTETEKILWRASIVVTITAMPSTLLELIALGKYS